MENRDKAKDKVKSWDKKEETFFFPNILVKPFKEVLKF